MSNEQGSGIPINFSTFIMSMAANVNIHLGLMPNPMNNEQGVDLNLAQQTIDIISILQEKTKGNLDTDEDKLMEGLLYDLRMKYLQAQNGGSEAS